MARLSKLSLMHYITQCVIVPQWHN